MNPYTEQNPFDPQFDPDHPRAIPVVADDAGAAGCGCGLTRRQTLLMAGSLMALPLATVASPLVPCVQTRQKITPCRHKFCRHYQGENDHYGR